MNQIDRSNGTCSRFVEPLEPRCLLSVAAAPSFEADLHPAAVGIDQPMQAKAQRRAMRQYRVDPLYDIKPLASGDDPQGYTPQQMRRAYGLDSMVFPADLGAIAGDGRGQTIAIVSAFHHPYIVRDLATFSQAFDLPVMNQSEDGPTFKRIRPRGQKVIDPGWAMETSLDVQWAHAIAPQANILLVEARSNRLSDMLSAVRLATRDPAVSVVSMSWGGSEFNGQHRFDRIFSTPYRHKGVTFVAASGDHGSPAIWPSTSVNVLAVGGTTLTLDSGGNRIEEIGWSGSGGGESYYVSRPDYQTGYHAGMFRSAPDVAYNADVDTGVPVYTSVGYNGRSGWFQVGGTSAGAPQWAAMIAIANQGRALAGLGPLDGASQVLPALYKMPAANFFDITSGSSKGYTELHAVAGYDHVTGLGSPNANLVIADFQTPPDYVPWGYIPRKPVR